MFKKEIEGYVKVDGDKIEVNWRKIRNKSMKGEWCPRFEQELTEHLLELGVLSRMDKDNFGVFGTGVCLDPKTEFSMLYFTKKEYAESYRDGKFSNAFYDVGIRAL